MEIRSFWVDVENAAGQRVGRGPLRALNFEVTPILDECGEIAFEVSAADPNLSALAEKLHAVCRYVDADGTVKVFGRGVIDKIKKRLQADGSMSLHVSGNDQGRELTYRSVGQLDLSGISAAGVTDAPTRIMALAPSGWTILDGSTDTNVYAGFDGESVLYALNAVSQKIGEHWRLDGDRVVRWLGPASGFAASGVRAVQHVNDPVSAETASDIAVISNLEEESDAADLISRVIPRGTGNGSVALTLNGTTTSPPAGYTVNVPENYVRRDDAEADYGRIERALEFPDIGPLSNTRADIQAAANMLMLASVEHLRRYGAPQKYYTIEFGRVGQLLNVGETLRVVYRKIVDGAVVYDLDGTYVILSTTARISAEGISTVEALVSTIDRPPQSDDGTLANEIASARVLATHQQLGPSVDTLTWRDEMDDGHGANLRFWVGSEYTSIQRALLRFKIQPLRSTVKSVADSSRTTSAGGGATATSSSGGSSSPTSSSGGGGTSSSGGGGTQTASDSISWTNSNTSIQIPSGANHYHGIGATMHTHPVVIPDHTHTLSDHTHSVSVPDHTHSVDVPAHSHEITPEIEMQYGLFEESSANTLGLADLSIRLNYGANLLSIVQMLGGGWYEVDITDVLVDDVFRPRAESNEIQITTTTADKSARIEAQLTIRGVVQATQYE